MTLTLLPSAEGTFVEWAKAQADLFAVHGGRVGTRLNATLPAIRVIRVGGIPEQESWTDEPELQVEAWASDQPTAERFIRQIVAALPTFRGTFVGGQVRASEVVAGPYWAPDDTNLSTNARYIVSVRLITTP